MKRVLSLILVVSLFLSLLTFVGLAEDVVIDLFGIGDFGGALDDSGTATGNPGGARIVGKMKELTAAVPNPVVVVGGTSYTGSAISETNHGELVNAMYKAMGVSFAAVGNHDFDWSDETNRAEVFSTWEQQGNFKFLNANVYTTEGERVFTPYATLEMGGVKVGFFSIIDESNMSAISGVNKAGIEMKDRTENAVEAVKALRNEGAQVIVALAHLYGAQEAPYSVEQVVESSLADWIRDVNAACSDVGGINAVFGSQTTVPLCGYVDEVPVVKAQNFGKLIGHLSVTVAADGKVTGIPELIPMTQIMSGEESLFGSTETTREELPVDADFLAVYNTYNDELAVLMDAPRGYSDTEMSFEGDDLKFAYQKWYLRHNLYYLNNVYGEHVDAYFHQKGGIRNIGSEVIHEGDTISLRTLYASAPFENYIYTLDMTGKDIKALLSGECQYGTYASLLQYGFDVVYESGDPYEGNGPITSVKLNGEDLEDEKVYRIATNSFLYPGPGDGIDFSAGTNASKTNVLNRTALLQALLDRSANLDALAIGGTLTPAFEPTVYEYEADTIGEVSFMTKGADVATETAENGDVSITVTSPFTDPYAEPGTISHTYVIHVK